MNKNDADLGIIITWRRDQDHNKLALISEIVPWSPAMMCNEIQVGDVLTSINGHPVRSPLDTEHLFGPQDSLVRISLLRPRRNRYKLPHLNN